MKMEVGKQYELTATRFEQTDWGGWIFLTDGKGSEYSVKAWPYQIEEGGPRTSSIKVFVKSWDSLRNRPILWQDRYSLLKETFEGDDRLHRNAKFRVVRIDDDKTLTIQDEYYGLTHTYKTHNAKQYSEGQTITLYVDTIHVPKSGSAYLKLEEARSRERVHNNGILFTTRDVVLTETSVEKKSVDEFPCEGDFVELKTSIVFDPETSQPNIDKQLSKIVRSIAAFINGKGGTIYIGVTDKGVRCGIENDLPYLNSGSTEQDTFSGQYKTDVDHYELKIRHMVLRRLGAYAGSLISVTHDVKNGKTVVKVAIEQGKNVVYFNGESVFQRQGNRIQQLRGHEISNFVLYRNSEELYENLKSAQSKVKVEDESEVQESQISSAESKRKTRVSARQSDNHDDLKNHSLWHTLKLYDGGWAVDNNTHPDLGDAITSIDIEQYHSVERYRLLLIYEKTGNVDVLPINLKKELGGEDKENKWLNKKGYSISKYDWSGDNAPKLVCAHKRDILAVIYKVNDKTYVKTVLVENFNLHNNFSAGNFVVPNKGAGITEQYVYLIPQRYYEQIYKLNKPISYEGIDITNPRYQYFINNLDNILYEEHNVCFL